MKIISEHEPVNGRGSRSRIQEAWSQGFDDCRQEISDLLGPDLGAYLYLARIKLVELRREILNAMNRMMSDEIFWVGSLDPLTKDQWDEYLKEQLDENTDMLKHLTTLLKMEESL